MHRVDLTSIEAAQYNQLQVINMNYHLVVASIISQAIKINKMIVNSTQQRIVSLEKSISSN